MSSIVTFYSYKGGVGRTMAMANVAVLLAQRKLKVLAVDWDLEAPGLERYFAYFSVTPVRGGLLRLLRDQQHGSRGHYQQHLTHVSGTLGKREFTLDVLPSGRETDPAYAAILEQFDWEEYFANGGGEFIEELRVRWRKEYDVVLVDSRTGLSDTGGICTIQLPDVVVAMFTANYQSLDGVRDTMRLAQLARNRLAYDRMHLRVLPVPARFSSRADTPEAADWLDRIAKALDDFYQDWIPKGTTARQVSEALRIPQIDAFGFGEKLAVVEEEGSTTRPMTAAYEQVAELLAAEIPDIAAILHLQRTATTPAAAKRKTTEGYEHDLFVSHAGASVLHEWLDAFIRRLSILMAKRLGRPVSVFQDRSEVRVGEVWNETTARSLVRSRAMLALISPEFVASQWCRLEWATFERREMEHPNHPPSIMPVIVQPTPELPDWIARRLMMDVSDLPRRASAFTKSSLEIDRRLEDLASVLVEHVRAAPPFDPAWTAVMDSPSVLPAPAMPPPVGGSDSALDADALTALLKTGGRADALAEARQLLRKLRRDRDFVALAKLAGAIHEHAPRDFQTSIHYARALIETGQPERARELLTPLVGVLPREVPEFSEAAGLLGRIHKERFVASPSKRSPDARNALLHAVDAYRAGYDANRKDNTWHGLNVVALLAAARRHKISTASRRNEKSLARTLLAQLEETPESLRRSWDLASIAELHLALGHWAEFGEHLRRYMENPEVDVFVLNSFLRHLTEIWELESDLHGAPYIAALRARVLSTPGGSVELRPTLTSPPPLALVPRAADKMSDHKTLQWFRLALDRAQSVGAVMDRSEKRLGTCFLVHARDVGIKRDECLVLTASHVVSTVTKTAAKPKDITVSFEASGSPRRFKIAKEVWSSSVDELDATLLRLERPPQDLPGLPLASELPSLEVPQRVYLIGHAGGKQLEFSLQDNELLDHEGPPEGTPAIPGVVRLHYRAPTQAGSSGSPVFDSEWRLIALHHSGGRETVRLNRRPGTYEVNEGIWIQSIAAALKQFA